MTRLTYVFPYLSGGLKVALPYLIYLRAATERRLWPCRLWSATWFSLCFLSLCFAYLAIQLILVAFQRVKLHDLVEHAKGLVREFRSNKRLLWGLLNGVSGAFEICFLVVAFSQGPKVSTTFTLMAQGVGQLLTALVLDLLGLLWVSRVAPADHSSAGASLLALGAILLFAHPSAASSDVPTILISLPLGLASGVASTVSHVLTHRLSVSLRSYWAGTATLALIQTGVLGFASVIGDAAFAPVPLAKEFVTAVQISGSTAVAVVLTFLAALSYATTSTCLQFFGGVGSYFTAIGPLVAGQTLVAALFEFWGADNDASDLSPITHRALPTQLPFTLFVFLGLISVFFGSIFMWVGRWKDASIPASLELLLGTPKQTSTLSPVTVTPHRASSSGRRQSNTADLVRVVVTSRRGLSPVNVEPHKTILHYRHTRTPSPANTYQRSVGTPITLQRASPEDIEFRSNSTPAFSTHALSTVSWTMPSLKGVQQRSLFDTRKLPPLKEVHSVASPERDTKTIADMSATSLSSSPPSPLAKDHHTEPLKHIPEEADPLSTIACGFPDASPAQVCPEPPQSPLGVEYPFPE